MLENISLELELCLLPIVNKLLFSQSAFMHYLGVLAVHANQTIPASGIAFCMIGTTFDLKLTLRPLKRMFYIVWMKLRHTTSAMVMWPKAFTSIHKPLPWPHYEFELLGSYCIFGCSACVWFLMYFYLWLEKYWTKLL